MWLELLESYLVAHTHSRVVSVIAIVWANREGGRVLGPPR